MDKKTFITIAVTAAISVTLTQAMTLLMSFARTKLASDATKTRARKIFSETNVTVLLSIFGMGMLVFWLVKAVTQTAPITRLDIVKIIALFAGIIFWLVTIVVIFVIEKIMPRSP